MEPEKVVAEEVAGYEVNEMKLEMLKLEDDEMELVLHDSGPAFANALRRAAIQEIPVMAVDEVEFKVNNSAMYDEILSHRLAMIPLRTPLKGYSLPGECGCREGRCPKCSVDLTLKREGPTIVMSGDLKSSDDDVVPVSSSIPLLKLEKGQELELTAIARLGFGKDNAKCQAGVIAYKYMPVLEFDEKACNACGECVKACPNDVLEIVDDKVKVKNLTLCTMCEVCVEVCSPKAVKVSGDSTKLIFRIESSGTLPPEQILIRATEALGDKFEEFSKLVKKL